MYPVIFKFDGAPVEGMIVYDPDGREIRLGELWAAETVVLVFVRHFGCLFCRQQVAAIGSLRRSPQATRRPARRDW